MRTGVIDSGHGMLPNVIARAFEPFFTAKEAGKGTGLGLSQVCGFIAQSGGELVLASSVGRGATVNIYLPDLDAPVKAVEAVELESVPIVEDEADLMDVASEMLRSMGYEVISASNGSDALDMTEGHPEGLCIRCYSRTWNARSMRRASASCT